MSEETPEGYPSPAALLPHAAPMVLLDEVVAFGARSVRCVVTPRDGSPFVADGYVQTIVTLEYMAQAVGVFAGLGAVARGEPIHCGFIVACRDMELDRERIAVGTRLTVDVEQVWGDARVGQFKCQVHDPDGRRVAWATVSVAQASPSELPP